MLRGRSGEVLAVEQALDDGVPAIIRGEPGIGKTLLLRALADKRAPSYIGGALPSLSWKPYLPLARALRQDIPTEPGSAAALVTAAVGSGLLVLDDLHWADEGTLGLLPVLAEQIHIAGSIRNIPATGTRALAAMRTAGARVVELGGLDDQAMTRVVEERLPSLDPDDVARAVARAGGNPLVALELARAGEVPDHLAKAIASTLETMSAPARRTLALLTLLGRPAPLDLADSSIIELERDGLVQVRGSHVALRHRLLGELWVDQLSQTERREIHEHIASLAADRGEAARHFAAAGDDGATLSCALEAADTATSPIERARHLELAASTAEAPSHVHVEAAWALLEIDDPAAAASVLGNIPGDAGSTEIQLVRCLAHTRSGDAPAARAAASVGLLAAASSDGTDHLDRLALEDAALQVWPFWNPDTARDRLARLERGGTRASAVAGAAEMQLGVDAEGRGLTALIAAADRRAAALAAGALAFADAAHEDLLGLVSGDDDLPLDARFTIALLQSVLAVHQGESDTTIVELRRLLEEPRLADREIAIAHLAVALADRGSTGDALAVLATPVPTSTPTGTATLAWARAETELAGGRLRRALVAARNGIDACPRRFPAAQLAELTAAWAALDSGELIERPPRHASHPAAHAEHAAIASFLRGEFLEAEPRFSSATEAWRPRNLRSALRCAWGAAESLRRGGGRDEAVTRLTHLEDEAGALGWLPLVARVRASLRAAGVRRKPGRGPTAHGITLREREIITLVGSGLSSRQIAQELGIAASTVDTHVESAVRKLGARSRRQAAAMVAELEQR